MKLVTFALPGNPASQRLGALTAMFERYDYPALEALTRARILYYMQIGYNDAELHEPMAERLRLLPTYLLGFTGRTPRPSEINEFIVYAQTVQTGAHS